MVRDTTLIQKANAFYLNSSTGHDIRYSSLLTVATDPTYLPIRLLGDSSQVHSISSLGRSSHLRLPGHQLAELEFTYLLVLIIALHPNSLVMILTQMSFRSQHIFTFTIVFISYTK